MTTKSLEARAREAAEKIMSCACDDAYRSRGLVAPDCAWHNYGDDLCDMATNLARDFARDALDTYIANTEHGWDHESAKAAAIDAAAKGDE